jgi:hypothetical protein
MSYKLNILILSISLFLLANVKAIAQNSIAASKLKTINIPFEANRFDTSGRKAVFTNKNGANIMTIGVTPTRQTIPVTLRGFQFTNGTIEFDAMPADDPQDMIAINFHQKDIYNHESLYLRTQLDESPQRDNAIQYTPFIHGINMWDMYKAFRGYALIYNKSWNHFKLVINGLQMMVYVNSPNQPTLRISRLEGNQTTGLISFDGSAMFKNLVIKPGATEGLSPAEGLDWSENDPTYIRQWQVTNPQLLGDGMELSEKNLPSDTVTWQPIATERRGLVNLVRKFEGPELTSYPKSRRYVWLKTYINSLDEQKVKLQLGFNKEVYVFMNRRLLYTDKNEAGMLYNKYPGGLLDIANTSFFLPLQKGKNELLIGVAVQNYGWGIAARVESLKNIFISSPIFDSKNMNR